MILKRIIFVHRIFADKALINSKHGLITLQESAKQKI